MRGNGAEQVRDMAGAEEAPALQPRRPARLIRPVSGAASAGSPEAPAVAHTGAGIDTEPPSGCPAFEVPREVESAVPPSGLEEAPAAETRDAATVFAEIASSDGRRSRRKTARLAGLIHVGRGRPDVECSIRDISATGALVSLAVGGKRDAFNKRYDIPDRFWLTMKADRMQVDCRVVRWAGDELGVEFLCAPRFI